MSRYSDLVVAQGADHYWPLNETGGTYFDAIGSVHVATLTDMTSELAVVNNGAKFNGSTSVARTSAVDTSLTFLNTAGFSYSYIAKFTSYNANKGVISKRSSTTTNRSFTSFVFNTTSGSGLSFDIGSNQLRWSTNYYPPLNEWVHIAYTYEPSTNTGRAYVNGSLLASFPYNTNIPGNSSSSSHFMIGALESASDGSASNYMSGTINAIAMFTRKTLSAAEVRAQYNTAFPITRIFDGTNWNDADKRVIQ